MQLRSILLATSAMVAATVAATVTAGSSAPQGRFAVDGDEPEFQFRAPVLNGMGVSSLDELRGKPVLVEFWGTR